MISIIIPVYNVENYILDCLKSFEYQYYKNFELIIVNDGSTDKSLERVKKFSEKSKLDIKIITQKNQGVSAARNIGIKNSIGEYICFIDSDDMISPRYLQELFEILNEDINVSICNIKNISEEVIYTKQLDKISKNKVKVYSSEEALNKFLLRDINPGIWALMLKKEILEKNEIWFTEGARYSEDIEFIYKIMANANKIIVTDDKLYYYRLRKNSAMAIANEKRKDGFELMKGLEKYFSKKTISFSNKFKRFGVARWVYATLWQIALASQNYSLFKQNCKIYLPNKNMKKLLSFPKMLIKITAMIYIISPYFYFIIINKIFKIFIKRRIKEGENLKL